MADEAAAGDASAAHDLVEGWSEWRPLMGEDVLMRVKSGPRSDLPVAEVGTVVRCRDVSLRLVGGDAPGEVLETTPSLDAEIGKADVVPGLELALRNSREGEVLQVRIAPKFAFGPAERPSPGELPPLPPNSTVQYELVVWKHTSAAREFPASPEQQLLFSSVIRKEAGNRWFSFREFGRAGRAYSEAVQLTESSESASLAELLRTRVDCLNNLAAVHLNVGEFLKAREACVRVLENDPQNTKACRMSISIFDLMRNG